MIKSFLNEQKLHILIGFLVSVILALWPFQKDMQLYNANKERINKYIKLSDSLNNNIPQFKELKILRDEIYSEYLAENGKVKFIQNFIISIIAYFFISLVISYSLFLFSQTNKVLTNVDGTIHILDKANTVYKKIIEKHNEIENSFGNYLSKKISSNDFGGFAFIRISKEEYANWLSETLTIARYSYLGVMRFDPNLLLEMTTDTDISIFNNKFYSKGFRKGFIRRRVMIFSKEDFRNYFRKMEENNKLEEFFTLHQNIDLFYVNSKEIEYFATQKGDFSNALYDDFALIDKKIVLKKENGLGGSILFGEINPYTNFFKDEYWGKNSSLCKYHNKRNKPGFEENTILKLFEELKKENIMILKKEY